MTSNDRLIRKPEALSMTGLSSSAMARQIREEQFPTPVLLVPGGRAVGFSLLAVQQWISGRLTESAARSNFQEHTTNVARRSAQSQGTK